jgi:hypothetical protein
MGVGMNEHSPEMKKRINHLVNFEGKKSGNKFAVMKKRNEKYRKILACHFHFGDFVEKEKIDRLAKELI